MNHMDTLEQRKQKERLAAIRANHRERQKKWSATLEELNTQEKQ